MFHNSKIKLALLTAGGALCLWSAIQVLVPKVFALSDREARARADQLILEIKEDGLPTDFESLNHLYKSRTNPENTEAWIEILEYLNSAEFMNSSLHTHPFQPARAPMNKYLEDQKQLLKDNADVLSHVHRLASKKESVRFEFDYAESFSTYFDLTGYFTNRTASWYDYTTPGGFSRLQQLQLDFVKVIELLDCGVQAAILQKDSATVLKSLITQIRLLSISQGEDLFVTHLRNAKMQGLVLNNVRIAIEANVLTESELGLLLIELKTIPSSIQQWQRIIQYERAWSLPYLQGKVEMMVDPEHGDFATRAATLSGNDLLKFIQGFDDYEHIDWSSWNIAKNQLKHCEDNQSRDRSKVIENRVVERVFFDWLEMAELLARSVSERNQAIVGCALQMYFRKNGTFPQELSQLNVIDIDSTLLKSIADEPFGYQIADGIAYLWGPRQEGIKEPFITSSTIPQDNSKSLAEPIIITKTIWKLNSQQ